MYVGQTGAHLRAPLQQHLYAIRMDRVFYWALILRSIEGASVIMGLEANPGWLVGRSVEKDGEGVDRLNAPLGLNVRCGLDILSSLV